MDNLNLKGSSFFVHPVQVYKKNETLNILKYSLCFQAQ